MILSLSFIKLFKPFLRLIIVVAIIFYIGFSYAGGFDSSLFPGFLIIICIPVLPTVYLAIEYYLVARNQIVNISESEISIDYKNGTRIYYKAEDIEVINMYKSAGMEKGSFPYQTPEMYYHAEVIAKDGKRLILTSVLSPKIDDALDLLKGVDKKVFRTAYSTIYI